MEPQLPDVIGSPPKRGPEKPRRFLEIGDDFKEADWVGTGVSHAVNDTSIPCGNSTCGASTTTHHTASTDPAFQTNDGSINVPTPPEATSQDFFGNLFNQQTPNHLFTNVNSVVPISSAFISRKSKSDVQKCISHNNNSCPNPDPEEKITETSPSTATTLENSAQKSPAASSLLDLFASECNSEDNAVSTLFPKSPAAKKRISSVRNIRKTSKITKNEIKADYDEDTEAEENPFNWISAQLDRKENDQNSVMEVEADENPFSWITATTQIKEDAGSTGLCNNILPGPPELITKEEVTPAAKSVNTNCKITQYSDDTFLDYIKTSKSVKFDNSENSQEPQPNTKDPSTSKKSISKVSRSPKLKRISVKSNEVVRSPQKFGPEVPIRKITITSSNTQVLSSESGLVYSDIVVSRCRAIIPTSCILKACHNVTSLTFQHLLRHQNVLNFFRACTTLTVLSIVDVSLQKDGFEQSENLSLPNLKELHVINSFTTLSAEYFLLDFVFNWVEMNSLQKLSVCGPDRAEQAVSTTSTELKSMTSIRSMTKSSQKLAGEKRTTENDKNFFLAAFMIKNASSLKFVSVRGDGCALCDSVTSDIIDSLKELNLESLTFGMNTAGVEVLLRCQSSLKHLTCKGFTRRIRPAVHLNMCKCIERNWKTLESVGIFPCVIGNGATNDLYALNCNIFSRCVKLQRLYINITAAKSENTGNTSYGTILGMENLPDCLVHIEIYTEAFLKRQLEMFAMQFTKYIHLQKLVLSSSFKQRYTVMPSWVQVLLDLPKIKRLDFLGGKVENKVALEEIMKNNRRSEFFITTHHPRSISFARKPLQL